jgi:hypothetical protein
MAVTGAVRTCRRRALSEIGIAAVGRGTASTTLSRLAKSGELTKTERGYRLAEPVKPGV